MTIDSQDYKLVKEMVEEDIWRTTKYLKAMKKLLKLINRNKPKEKIQAALNEAKSFIRISK